MQACAFLRERFPEDKHIRLHPAPQLRPDQAVNFVPDWASVESYARAVDPGTITATAGSLIAPAARCAQAVGDVSQVKPCVTAGLPGSNCKFHSPAFRIDDEEAACAFPATFLSRYLEDLADRLDALPLK